MLTQARRRTVWTAAFMNTATLSSFQCFVCLSTTLFWSCKRSTYDGTQTLMRLFPSRYESWLDILVSEWHILHTIWYGIYMLRNDAHSRDTFTHIMGKIDHLPATTQHNWARFYGFMFASHANAINSLWPSDAVWRKDLGQHLVQVMACCLTAPSYYLNQCWLIISEVRWHSYQGDFTRDASTINH